MAPAPPPVGPGGGGASGAPWRPLVIVGLVIAVITLGAIVLTGDDDEATVAATSDAATSSSRARPTTSTTEEEPVKATTTKPEGESGGEDSDGEFETGGDGTPIATDMEDGEHFVFIHVLDAPARIVSFDLAQLLTGQDAQQAAEEDGAVAPGEPVPNDYYIRNVNDRLRDLSVKRNVKVQIVDWADCCGLIPGDFEPFAAAFDLDADTSGEYHGPDSPYLLTVRGGFVTEIEEVFLP